MILEVVVVTEQKTVTFWNVWSTPVVHRELSVYSRQLWTYWIRTCLALGGLGIFIVVSYSRDFEIGAGKGQIFVIPLAAGLFFAAAIVGIRSTYDTIGRERRQGTLSLMYLTGLQPEEVMIAKVASNGLQNIWAILAILPLLGMPLVIGGVTALMFVEIMIAVVLTVATAMTIGFLKSCEEPNEHLAFSQAIRSFGQRCLSPLGPMLLFLWAYLDYQIFFAINTILCYQSTASTWDHAQVAFSRAWRNSADPSAAQATTIRATVKRTNRLSSGPDRVLPSGAVYGKKKPTYCGDRHPGEWIVNRYADTRQVSARMVGVVFCLALLPLLLFVDLDIFMSMYFAFVIPGRLLYLAALAKIAPQAFGEITGNGAIEILQTTQVRMNAIVRRVIKRLSLDVVLGGLPFLAVDLIYLYRAQVNLTTNSADFATLKQVFLIQNQLTWSTALATIFVGIWMGIRYGSLSRGAYWTVAYLLIGPVVLLLLVGIDNYGIILALTCYALAWAGYAAFRLWRALERPEELVPRE